MIINLLDNDETKIKELETKFNNIYKKGDIKKSFKNNPYTNYLIYIDNNEILGFINYYLIYNRIEIANFNVLESFQNKGIGTLLIEELIKIFKSKEIINITLEVRKNNVKAIHIYKKFGFKERAIRKNYYDGVDAILMEKELM